MIGKIIHASFLSTIFSLLLLCPVPSAKAAQCSTAKGAGAYGFTLSGVLVLPSGPVPIAAVGRAALKADGTASGTEARNVGGQYADETFTGTFSINADCTGIATLSFYENGQLVRTSVLATVYDDNNNEIRMVQKSLTLPNGEVVPAILTVEARRIASIDED
jgi:hypothetical protein